jgi:hypothetical protein
MITLSSFLGGSAMWLQDSTWPTFHFRYYQNYICLPLTSSIAFRTFRGPSSFHPRLSPLAGKNLKDFTSDSVLLDFPGQASCRPPPPTHTTLPALHNKPRGSLTKIGLEIARAYNLYRSLLRLLGEAVLVQSYSERSIKYIPMSSTS